MIGILRYHMSEKEGSSLFRRASPPFSAYFPQERLKQATYMVGCCRCCVSVDVASKKIITYGPQDYNVCRNQSFTEGIEIKM